MPRTLTSTVLRRRFVLRLAAAQDNLCFYCDRPLQLADYDKAVRYANGDRQGDDVASIDHIIPRARVRAR